MNSNSLPNFLDFKGVMIVYPLILLFAGVIVDGNCQEKIQEVDLLSRVARDCAIADLHNHGRNGALLSKERERNSLDVTGRDKQRGGTEDTMSWAPEPDVPRVVSGSASRVDKSRIKALGNCCPPQQYYPVLQAISAALY